MSTVYCFLPFLGFGSTLKVNYCQDHISYCKQPKTKLLLRWFYIIINTAVHIIFYFSLYIIVNFTYWPFKVCMEAFIAASFALWVDVFSRHPGSECAVMSPKNGTNKQGPQHPLRQKSGRENTERSERIRAMGLWSMPGNDASQGESISQGGGAIEKRRILINVVNVRGITGKKQSEERLWRSRAMGGLSLDQL